MQSKVEVKLAQQFLRQPRASQMCYKALLLFSLVYCSGSSASGDACAAPPMMHPEDQPLAEVRIAPDDRRAMGGWNRSRERALLGARV